MEIVGGCGGTGRGTTALRQRLRMLGLTLTMLAAVGCSTFNGAGKSVIDCYEGEPTSRGGCDATQKPKGTVVVGESGEGGQQDENVIPTLHQLITHNLSSSSDIRDKRNAYLTREIIQLDEQYDRFIRQLYQNRTRADLGTSLLQLFLGVAGTLTDSTGVQKNYAAGSALISGADSSIDKNVFMDKTISALISSMDAQRGRALERLRTGMTLSIENYPVVQAQADLYDYQRAGTLIGGLSFIEEAAKAQVKDSQENIQALPLLTPERMATKFCIARTLIDQNFMDRVDLDKLRQAVVQVAGSADAPAIANVKTRAQMIDYLKQQKADPERIDAVSAAMSKAGILLNPCPKDE